MRWGSLLTAGQGSGGEGVIANSRSRVLWGGGHQVKGLVGQVKGLVGVGVGVIANSRSRVWWGGGHC